MSDDLTDILGPAYATYDEEGKIKPGVVCIGVIPYVMEEYYTIRPVDPDPRSSDHQRYCLVKKTAARLASDGQDKWSFPFKDMNLDADEDLVVFKVKRRPVVVVSKAIVEERKADPSRFQDSFLCVPSYTLVDSFLHPQVNQSVIEDILALSYRCCFPLPYDPFHQDRLAALRLDRMQPIPRHLLKVADRRLSTEWTLYIQEWIRLYLTGRLGDDDSDKNTESVPYILRTARDLLMAELAKRRAVSPEGGRTGP